MAGRRPEKPNPATGAGYDAIQDAIDQIEDH